MQRENPAMGVTMAGQFVASFRNLANKRGITLRHPAKHKEGSAPSVFGEQVQDALAISMHTRGKGWPILRPDVLSKRFNMKIVLDIHAQRVGDRVGLQTTFRDFLTAH